MKKIILYAVAAMVAAVTLSARAVVVVATNTATYYGVVNGVSDPTYELNITYDVTLDSGVYTYNYFLVTSPAESIYSFTLGGAPDPINTETMAIQNYGGASVSGSGISNDSVGWLWGFNSGVTTADVSFTSTIAPTFATFTFNDDDILWSSPPPIPAPLPMSPVPEPSSLALLAASALVYCLFRYRQTHKLSLQKVSRDPETEIFSFEKVSLF